MGGGPVGLLCSRNTHARKVLVGRAQWEAKQATPKERHRGGSPWLHSDVMTTMMYILMSSTAALEAFVVR